MTGVRRFAICGVAVVAMSGAACGKVTSAMPDATDGSMPDARMKPPSPQSCKALFDNNPALSSGAYPLRTADGASYQAYCDMTTDGGGWTLVMKIDGTAASSQLGYDGALWTNTATLKADQVDTSRVEAKYRAFNEVAFSKLRIVMVEAQSSAMTLAVSGSSVGHLMRGPFVQIARPRQDWLALLPGAIVQPNCNQGGINNSFANPFVRVRIGMVGNEQADCTSPDSFIGIGGGGGSGNGCFGTGAFLPPSAGSVSGGTCNPTPGPNHPAFAYVYVR